MKYRQVTCRNPAVEHSSTNTGLLPIVLLLCLLLVLAGCGDSNGGDTPDDNSNQNTTQSLLPPDADGMPLSGDGGDNAVGATVNLAPSPVAADRIDGSLLTTRLAAVIAPDASVGDVNAALASVGAAIVSMLEDDPFVVLVIDAVVDYAEAQAKADLLVNSGAFVYARPGLTLAPDTETAIEERPAGFAARAASRLPSQQALDFVPHLVPARVPATWNLRSMASGDGWLVVPGIYADVSGYTEVSQLGYGSPEGRALQSSDALEYSAGNSGFYMLGVAAANWDFDETSSPHTGVHPAAEERLEVIAPRVYGLDRFEIMMVVRLNLPQGAANVTLLSTDTFDDPPGNVVRFLDRAWMALHWRQLMQGIPGGPDFLHIVSAGSGVNGFGTNAQASLDSVYGVATVPNLLDVAALDGSGIELAVFEAAFNSAVENQPTVGQPLDNILIVGGSDVLCNESIVSVPGAQVRMVSDNVVGPCVAGVGCNAANPLSRFENSSDAAAAQAAGLAAYLWSLDEAMSLDTLLLRLQHAYSSSSLPGVLDAWIAVLSLDRDLASARLRRALLDVSGPGGQPDGAFTEHDIRAFLDAFDAFAGSLEADWSDYDLNGDGWTGGAGQSRMDIDVNDLPGFTEVSQTVNGQEKLFDESAVTDVEVLCYYAWSELYSGNPVSRSDIPDCGGGLAVEHDQLLISLIVDTDEGTSRDTQSSDPQGDLSTNSFGDWTPEGTDVRVEEAAFADAVWNEEFNENTLSLQRFSYRFDARVIVSVSGSDFSGSYEARAESHSATTLRFTVNEPVTISITGQGSGDNFSTGLDLIGNSILYEVDETLESVPIDYTGQLSPGSYTLTIDPFILLEVALDSQGTASETSEGFLELTVEFN